MLAYARSLVATIQSHYIVLYEDYKRDLLSIGWFNLFGIRGYVIVLAELWKKFLRTSLWGVRTFFRYLYWFAAPDIYIGIFLRHTAMFVSWTLMWPLFQRLLIAPLWNKLNDGFSFLVFGGLYLQKVNLCRRLMMNATSYMEWKCAAEEMEEITGSREWRENPECKFYDYHRIRSYMLAIDRYMKSNRVKELMKFLRARLVRNCGGILSDELYADERVGTKFVIEGYIQRVCKALRYIVRTEQVSTVERLAFFNEVRHTYGRSALLLSGGGTFGLYHLGLVGELMIQGLLPKVISGASVGSIIVSALGCLSPEEFKSTLEEGGMELRFFEKDINLTTIQLFLTRLQRFLRTGYILDITILKRVIERYAGSYTFLEAYEKTGLVINITVMPATAHGLPRILNYLTAPNVVVWSASLCSCAIPGVFQSQELLEKDENGELVPFIQAGVEFSDGSFGSDLPIEQLSHLFNVNHFVVSQVNPFIVPFVVNARLPEVIRMSVEFFLFEVISITRWLCDLVKGWGIGFFDSFLNSIVNLATQQYTGNITYYPSPTLSEYITLISNPTEQLKQSCILRARRGTWGTLARLKIHCSVEYCLDDCLRKMRRHVLINAQKDIEPKVVEDINTVALHPVIGERPCINANSAAVGDKRHIDKHSFSPYSLSRSRSKTGIPVSNSEQNMFRRLENRDSFQRKSLDKVRDGLAFFPRTESDSEEIPQSSSASLKGSKIPAKVEETKNWLLQLPGNIGFDESLVTKVIQRKDSGRPCSESSTRLCNSNIKPAI